MNSFVGVVVCHGEMAESLVSAAQLILGETEDLFAFSNTGKSLSTLKDELSRFVDIRHNQTPVFFVDLKGGSCWSACRQVIIDKVAVVISGVNLAMMINFLTKRNENLSLTDLVEKIVESSQQSIMWSR